MLSRGMARRGLGWDQSLRSLSSRRATIRPIPRNFAAPFGISLLRQSRSIETENLTPASSHEILVAQRKRRPVSPHLSIYRAQINYFTSPTHRVTGVFISGTFYIFGISYLIAPVLGWHLDAASLAAAFGGLSPLVKEGLKFAVAWPFVFHSVNGVGHLIWDTGRRFSIKAIVGQGWTVVGLSLVGAGYLAFWI